VTYPSVIGGMGRNVQAIAKMKKYWKGTMDDALKVFPIRQQRTREYEWWIRMTLGHSSSIQGSFIKVLVEHIMYKLPGRSDSLSRQKFAYM